MFGIKNAQKFVDSHDVELWERSALSKASHRRRVNLHMPDDNAALGPPLLTRCGFLVRANSVEFTRIVVLNAKIAMEDVPGPQAFSAGLAGPGKRFKPAVLGPIAACRRGGKRLQDSSEAALQPIR